MISKSIVPIALAALLAFGAALPSAHAKSPYRVPVRFAWTNDAGLGYNWFVVGNHPDVGDWNPLRAAPLAWHEGNVWSADIGIQAGTELEYKFIKRPIDAAEYPDGNNTEWMAGDNLSLSVPAEPPAPNPGKRVVFRCPWDPPVNIVWAKLSGPFYDAVDGDWTSTELRQTGSGRYEGEVGEPGTWMRFTFSGYENGEQKWYHFYGTEDKDFYSSLDAFCVDAGQVFDYEPTNGISDSQIISTNVYSTADGIDGREIRIYLPRGYNENTNRFYPVVYFSDGQNVFQPGGPFGCWNAETAADLEIRAGHMREAILVAVPCRTDEIPGMPGSSEFARLWEYLPSTDTLMTTDLQGLGAKYADFLIHNVKPTLDYNFRTLSDRENTAHIGSSAGGLLSLYLGTAFGDVFGLVAPMSGVYNEEYIPKFRQWCLEHPVAVAQPKRVWLDTGTEETNVESLNLYESNWDALTLLLYAGHVPNKSLHFGVYSGWQGEHNEPAWADRLDEVFDFLLDVRDETNPLLLRPPEIGLDGMDLQIPAYPGFTYSVKRADSAMDIRKPGASTVLTTNLTDRPWGVIPCPATNAGFYWVEGGL